jgi:beta-lactam-binding protein with PASTA domain
MQTHRITRFLTLALAGTIFAVSPAFAQQNDRKAFGKGNPFTVEQLPEGKLRTKLETLNPKAKGKAMKWLHELQFSDTDAAHHLRADSDGGVFIICPDKHGDCDGHCTHGAEHTEEVEAGDVELAPSAGDGPQTLSGPLPVSNPPAYNSKPGAPFHIYLDFNGGVVSGKAWGGGATYNCLPWSTDTDRTTFSDAEQAAMKQVWQRMAEDYAPYNVNVTTDVFYDVENYTGDKNKVGWLIFTPTTDANGVACPHNGAGGVAYVGVFGNSNFFSAYQPAWVTPMSAANMAEAGSHEIGHNLGLLHDGTTTATYYGGHGTGDISWGPIMGTGYNRNVSQWSKGEYLNANLFEDDLAKIANRIPYRADDHGNTSATATPLTVSNGNVIASTTPENDPTNANPANKGIIERNTDVDVFSFQTGSGSVTLNVNPWKQPSATFGGNLDISIELRNSAGSLVASANPATNTFASITANLAAGTYFLHVANSGAGTPLAATPSGYTSYGSIGQYFISGTIAPENLTPVTVTLGNLAQTYNGSPKPVSVTTSPAGISVNTTYSGSSTAPTNAGSYAVVATVNQPGYSGSASGTLVVSKATPTVTSWPVAASIPQGQPVSAATLSGGAASVAGGFSYNAPATVLAVGTHAVAVTFTPTNAVNYNTVSGTVNVTVYPTATVPNVIGLAQASAESQILAANLTVGTVTATHDAFVPAGNVLSQDPSAGNSVALNTAVNLVISLGRGATTILLAENFENPTTPTAYSQGTIPNNGKWVGANQGFNSTRHGITDKAGGDFSAANPNHQAYAFRYTNSGLTSSAGSIGSLEAEVTYTVSFDVVRDNGLNAGTPYTAQLIAFASGAVRNDCRSIPSGSALLTSTTGNANSDGSFRRVSFEFTAPAGHAQVGKDLGIRFIGYTTSAIIDNVEITIQGAPPVQVTVPSVVGLARATAEANIVSANLTVGTVTEQHSATVPTGSVISQNPSGGSSVPQGSAVGLVVSLGKEMATVPNVIGFAQAAAEAEIVAANLIVGSVTTQSSATVPAGSVISQSPSGGARVAEGSAVNLVVSLGAVMVNVPNVTGFDQAAAETTILAAKLTVGTVTRQIHSSVPAGSVISQNPSGGASVAEGSAVNLVVSLGNGQVSQHAVSDIAVIGTVSGTFANTRSSDNIRQSITETETSGNAKNRTSQLEHKWAFNVSAADTVTFHIEAHHTANSEGDNFVFAYSTNGANGTYTNMVTVTKTSDNNTAQTYTLPPGTGGTVHVRVIDLNRTAGRRVLDTIHIDHMYFRSVTLAPLAAEGDLDHDLDLDAHMGYLESMYYGEDRKHTGFMRDGSGE